MSSGAGPHGGAGVTYGIDIGGTKVLGVALGAADAIVAEVRVPTHEVRVERGRVLVHREPRPQGGLDGA